jgi:amidase
MAAIGCASAAGIPAFGLPASLQGQRVRFARVSPFRLNELTLADLGAGMRAGKFSAVSLTKDYLARVEEIDRQGPQLRAVIETNPDALPIARNLDREHKAGRIRGPLHGIPILIKDNIGTHDRMRTTAGSLALAESIAAKDAFVVQRLRAAGAVILGKTNLSEWANFRSSRATSGWSGRGGLTLNPYVLDRNPSGSSSGSAVAVAANLCAVAVGTETDGSILSPASYNGIVGIKPTLGLVSRSGIIPLAHSQDTAGPMARTVADAAILLGCLAGEDAADAVTGGNVGKGYTDYSRFLDPDGLRGARVGVARGLFGSHAGVAEVMEAAMTELKRMGAVLIDPVDLPSLEKLGEHEFEVLLYEFKADLNQFLATLGPHAHAHSLHEVIEFNNRNRDLEMPWFGQDIMLKAQEKGPLTEPRYLAALEASRRLSREEGIDAVMIDHKLDALVAPTTGPAHVTDLVHGDRDTGGSTTAAAVAGYPSITVPAGFVSGLPVGLSFFGRAWSEPRLLQLAYAFEQATRLRKQPGFLPTVPR